MHKNKKGEFILMRYPRDSFSPSSWHSERRRMGYH